MGSAPCGRTTSSTDESYDSSRCISNLCDPPSDEGTYGSGSESCGSSRPIYALYQCAAVIRDHEHNLPPKLQHRKVGNRRSQSPHPTEKTTSGPSASLRRDGLKRAKPWQATRPYPLMPHEIY